MANVLRFPTSVFDSIQREAIPKHGACNGCARLWSDYAESVHAILKVLSDPLRRRSRSLSVKCYSCVPDHGETERNAEAKRDLQRQTESVLIERETERSLQGHVVDPVQSITLGIQNSRSIKIAVFEPSARGPIVWARP